MHSLQTDFHCTEVSTSGKKKKKVQVVKRESWKTESWNLGHQILTQHKKTLLELLNSTAAAHQANPEIRKANPVRVDEMYFVLLRC